MYGSVSQLPYPIHIALYMTRIVFLHNVYYSDSMTSVKLDQHNHYIFHQTHQHSNRLVHILHQTIKTKNV